LRKILRFFFLALLAVLRGSAGTRLADPTAIATTAAGLPVATFHFVRVIFGSSVNELLTRGERVTTFGKDGLETRSGLPERPRPS
jgi:hypothetical protein